MGGLDLTIVKITRLLMIKEDLSKQTETENREGDVTL